MSHIKKVVLPKIGPISVVCKTKRDISDETSLGKRDDESLGWLYWNRIWPSSVALSEWLIREFFPVKLAGKKILEIGCGTGLAGVVAARLGGITRFSDLVPVTLEAVKETCRMNHINHFEAGTLDWFEKIESNGSKFDMILGSEIFYDVKILAGIAQILEKMLAAGGTGIFCDPNRLGLDTVERAFQRNFILSVEKIPLNRLERKGHRIEKMATLYQLTPKVFSTF